MLIVTGSEAIGAIAVYAQSLVKECNGDVTPRTFSGTLWWGIISIIHETLH
jgi:hypothetical protein